MYCTSLHWTEQYFIPLHCTVLYYTALNCTLLHCTALPWTIFKSSALYWTIYSNLTLPEVSFDPHHIVVRNVLCSAFRLFTEAVAEVNVLPMTSQCIICGLWCSTVPAMDQGISPPSLPLSRVSKSCNHATVRLRKKFQVLRKIWVFEPKNT